MTIVRGTVISIHHHGATVRLEDGSLATIGAPELAANRPAYAASLATRTPLEVAVDTHGRHRTVALANAASAATRADEPQVPPGTIFDDAFEARIGAYFKATREWAPSDRMPPAERHFIRKKRRARLFEARADGT